MKQYSLFNENSSDSLDKKYNQSVFAPIYEPKNKCPHILELYDLSKTNRLINGINSSGVSEQEKKFLIECAKRHTVFNYSKIADYYAHASKEMQQLMEHSALIIIDFEKAIEYGYVKLSQDITQQYIGDDK